MRKRNLPASAVPSDGESGVEAPVKKQSRNTITQETPTKKLTIAEQRQRAKDWAEQNLSSPNPKDAPQIAPKTEPKPTSKGLTSTKKLTIEEQRKRAEDWAIQNGLIQSALKKRNVSESTEGEEEEESVLEEEEVVEPTPTKKRNVRRKTISTTSADEKASAEMDVSEQEQKEEEIAPRARSTRRQSQPVAPPTRRTDDDDSSVASSVRKSTRRSTIEPLLFSSRTPIKSTSSVESESFSVSKQRKKTVAPSVFTRPADEVQHVQSQPEKVVLRRKTKSQKDESEVSTNIVPDRNEGTEQTHQPTEVLPVVPPEAEKLDEKKDSELSTAVDLQKISKEVEEEVSAEEITAAQTRATLILLLVAQTLAALLLLVYFYYSFTGGVVVLLLVFAIAIIRRLSFHLFSSGTTSTTTTSTISSGTTIE